MSNSLADVQFFGHSIY